MDTKADYHHNADNFMDTEGSVVSAKYPGQTQSPGGFDIHARQTGRALDEKRDHQQKVKEPLYRAKSSDSGLIVLIHRVLHYSSQKVPGFPIKRYAAEIRQTFQRR